MQITSLFSIIFSALLLSSMNLLVLAADPSRKATLKRSTLFKRGSHHRDYYVNDYVPRSPAPGPPPQNGGLPSTLPGLPALPALAFPPLPAIPAAPVPAVPALPPVPAMGGKKSGDDEEDED